MHHLNPMVLVENAGESERLARNENWRMKESAIDEVDQ